MLHFTAILALAASILSTTTGATPLNPPSSSSLTARSITEVETSPFWQQFTTAYDAAVAALPAKAEATPSSGEKYYLIFSLGTTHYAHFVVFRPTAETGKPYSDSLYRRLANIHSYLDRRDPTVATRGQYEMELGDLAYWADQNGKEVNAVSLLNSYQEFMRRVATVNKMAPSQDQWASVFGKEMKREGAIPL
ncbi:MAG: hypothetical protein M1829_002683 [Trizodia sp. TS-e1964]|nr:MAG: hypothetical protein M1829_002683 [Trizodia sp. TS-e1964]